MCMGLNCALGVKHMTPFLECLSVTAERFVQVYSNAGLPNALGGFVDTTDDLAWSIS